MKLAVEKNFAFWIAANNSHLMKHRENNLAAYPIYGVSF